MIIGFDEFVIDGDRRQLVRGGQPVHLSPKAFELLSLLAANRPRALSKAELKDRLWPATFVSESNLATLIAEIRTALDDDARVPRFVRTAYGFGYAFSGEAHDVPRLGPTSPATSYWLITDTRHLALTEGENVIGRDPGTTVLLDSPTVSRRHARIVITSDGAIVEDLGSRNGTFVRNERVTAPKPLSDGDQIQIGSMVVGFKVWSSVRPVETDPIQGRAPHHGSADRDTRCDEK
jgi:DNA-binding winged helix-turn-helix (wHTH) protein